MELRHGTETWSKFRGKEQCEGKEIFKVVASLLFFRGGGRRRGEESQWPTLNENHEFKKSQKFINFKIY